MRPDPQVPPIAPPSNRHRSNRIEGRRVSAVVVTVLAVIGLLIAACATAATPGFSGPAGQGPPSVSPSTSASPSPSASPTPAFPITLTDDDGETVTLAAEPRRLVSLTPATTEILFALGVGDRVLAKVEDIADYPPAAHDIPVVATYQGVDVEKIVGLQPDLVIAGGNGGTKPEAVAKLRSLGIPVLSVYAADLAGVLKDVELTGDAVGRGSAARDITAALRAGFDQIQAATTNLPHPRVFYETGVGDVPVVYGTADDSFVASMISLAGGVPITTGSKTNWEQSREKLIEADPELIILSDGAFVAADSVKARPGWSVMTAVKNGAIVAVDDTIVTRPGPRLLEGLLALARAIHPDAALPSPSVPDAVPSGSASPS